jgi:hypothetical protein
MRLHRAIIRGFAPAINANFRVRKFYGASEPLNNSVLLTGLRSLTGETKIEAFTGGCRALRFSRQRLPSNSLKLANRRD